MRYRVEATERPDALYAAWGGGLFRAQRSTADGTLLLVVLPGEEAPAGFDIEIHEFEQAPAVVQLHPTGRAENIEQAAMVREQCELEIRQHAQVGKDAGYLESSAQAGTE